jgi:alginate O-acetyltransferase complex protein AlgI
MIAGPIVRYKDIADQLTGRKENVDQFSYGIRRFILGLGKKLIVADTVGNVADKVFAISSANLTTPLAWLGIVCYTIQIYYDFSAYSDMGIGLANIFGISFRENFNYPYISKDIKEFWRRWHISLSSWLRDYLYIPLGGSRISKTRTYVNLVIVFFVCGLWHGASWNFIIWGMYYGLFLVLERTSFSKFISWLWTPLRHVYTMLIVLIGWVFFRAETLAYSMQFIKTMFGFGKGSGVENYASMYLNFEVILVIVIGVIGSMPVIPWLIKFKNSNLRLRPVMIVLQDSYLFCVLIVSIIYLGMYLANSMKIPFIYYRF